jgi:hypothetical protein
MITYNDYMSGRNSKEDFYAQFITPAIIEQVRQQIGEAVIKASTDEHFNDIPLKRWDRLCLTLNRQFLKDTGFGNAPFVKVVLAKQAAKQIKAGE